MDCKLCQAYAEEKYRVVHVGKKVFSMIPIAPLREGHIMVLPIRHTNYNLLNDEEMVEAHRLLVKIKDKLKQRNPDMPPLIETATDTKHASIPEHAHWHIIPSPVNIRELVAHHDPTVHKNKTLDSRELWRMAERWNPQN